MSELILDSLEVKGFRAFRDLQIKQLGRVNLIVGKNNSGKTSLLEALRLYANRGDAALIWELVTTRDEITLPSSNGKASSVEQTIGSLRYIFYGRRLNIDDPPSIQIGPLFSLTENLNLTLAWFQSRYDESGLRRFQMLDHDEANSVADRSLLLQVYQGKQGIAFYPIDTLRRLETPLIPAGIEIAPIRNVFVSANGLNIARLSELWAGIALTDYEQDVIRALQIIVPELERVNFVVSRQGRDTSTELVPFVRITGSDGPIPMRSIGEGVVRLFGIALALANSIGGMLFIDEIESGLHYSIQADMWRLIFETARRLNVQVFATTHSWDCIEGFQRAADEDTQAEGVLIRLNNRHGEVTTTLFSEADLKIVTQQLIEVR